MSTSTQHRQEGFLPSVSLPRSNASISPDVEAHLCTVSTLSAASTALSIFPPPPCLPLNQPLMKTFLPLISDRQNRPDKNTEGKTDIHGET